MVTSAEVEEILSLGHELRSFEAKSPGDLSDKAYCAKIARAAMAMGNLRDGGLVCLGIDDSQLSTMKPGLSQKQLDDWSDYDNVNDALSRFSEPPVAFRLDALTLSNGVQVVVLDVAEFDQVPHVCKKDYPNELQSGATYVRPRGKPQSLAVPNVAEMRELLDLAVTKGVREFVGRLGQAGLGLGSVQSLDDATRHAFSAEAETAWANPSKVLRFIQSKGHFDASVTPSTFDPSRVSPEALESLIANNAVRLRGWPTPYVDLRMPILRHGEWIGQDLEAQGVPHCEAWRACTSGQFLHRKVFRTDVADAGSQLGSSAPDGPGAVVIWEVLFYAIELAEFAARIAAALECDSLTITLDLAGIAGRHLISGDWNRELDRDYTMHADRLHAVKTHSTAELLADPRRVGVALAQAILTKFGLKVPDQVLLDWQEQTLRR